MASGVFDIIHPGHISYLEQAKAMGDKLVVVVACDETVRKNKHDPITPEKMRAKIISSLKMVDEVYIGKSGNMFSIVKDVNPDIIVLGYDQKFDEKKIEEELAKIGLNVKVVRANEKADDLNATRKIIQKIRERMDL